MLFTPVHINSANKSSRCSSTLSLIPSYPPSSNNLKHTTTSKISSPDQAESPYPPKAHPTGYCALQCLRLGWIAAILSLQFQEQTRQSGQPCQHNYDYRGAHSPSGIRKNQWRERRMQRQYRIWCINCEYRSWKYWDPPRGVDRLA